MPKSQTPKKRAANQAEPRQLTPKSNLDNLRKEAKRWLKALRASDDRARERLNRAYPDAPAEPGLRDVQHALALEHGLAGWSALKKQLENQAAGTQVGAELTQVQATHSERVDLFLEYACADPILANGPAAHAQRARAALRILTRYPEIARSNIHTAVVCGDLQEVERILADRSEAATEPGGPLRKRQVSERQKLWTPLLHLCYGRLPLPAASDNAAAIAVALLDHGADPNDYFEVGSHPCRYTALCGLAGEGEDDAPPHPQKQALARLLFERGAEPYDIQVIYNIHFHGDVLWFLELMYEFSVKAGRQRDWDDPNWSMLNMGNYGSGARFHLDIAVAKNDLKLAEWVLEHGASPNAGAASDPRFLRRTLYEEAQRRGFIEMADLLVRFGATQSVLVREGIETFAEACFHLDRRQAQSMIEQHPEYLLSTASMFAAVQQDRADVVEFLLDLGMSIEIQDAQNQRPLHQAASHDSLHVAEVLIARGAEVDPVESNWHATPLGISNYGQKTQMIELLGRASRDIWELTWCGNAARLRELLSETPDFAKTAGDRNTPLMWLPDDEARAIDIVELLVAHGADPAVRNKEGMSAAECAEKRGLFYVAERLRTMERGTVMKLTDDPIWRDAVAGLERGDFSRLEPLFDESASVEGGKCRIVDWYEKGHFDNEPKALAEALSCACFLGRTSVAEFLLSKGVDPAGGIGTGLAAFHWAANRGNLDTVKLLIARKAPLEQKNMYGGTVLGCTVFSAINEPRGDQLAIIEVLLAAGANIEEAEYPTGNEHIDDVLRRYGAKA